MTRVASGILAALVSFLIGSHIVALTGGTQGELLIALVGSLAVGMIAACAAHRFSLTNNIAGDMGYDELTEREELTTKIESHSNPKE